MELSVVKWKGGCEAILAGRFLRIRTQRLTPSPMLMQIIPKGLTIDMDGKQGAKLLGNNSGEKSLRI
ncbi:hypothetical protein VZT92_005685 [Zoarces viviparus]|uniref:Uncharacterized protein n=1 Tax=Zoarces viviparus TaxID=48416 RepID=A0AAW1FT78_ZOAVI